MTNNPLNTLNTDFFRRLAETSSEAIGMAGLDSRLVYANTSLHRLLEISPDQQLQTLSFYDYFQSHDLVQLRDQIIPHVLAHGDWRGELRLVMPSGSEAHTLQTIFLICDDAGLPIGFANVISDLTQQMRTNESLRITEEAIESSLNAIAMSDLQGRITYVNQAFVHLWHLQSKSAAIGRLTHEFWVNPESAQDVLDAVRRDGIWRGEFAGRRANGSIAHVECSTHRVRGINRKTQFLMSSFVDITARKQAEHALKHEHQFATNLMRSTPVLMVLLNLDGSIRYINPFFEKYTGWSVANATGLDWFNTFLPEHIRAGVRADFGMALTRALDHSYILPLMGYDGREHAVEWKYQLLKGADGTPDTLMAAGLDVTDRIENERKMQQVQVQLNEAQRIAKVGSWEMDVATRHIACSDGLFNLMETDKEKFVSTPAAFLDLVHPDDRAAVHTGHALALQQTTPYIMTHRMYTPDGCIKWVEERVTTEFAADGTPTISRGTVQDVTERYRLELQLRSLNEQLEQRVAERSAELYKQNQRYAAILRSNPDGFCSVDTSGFIRLANTAYCTMLGYSEAELLQKNIVDIEAKNRPAEVAALMEHAERSGFVRFETHLRRKDGSDLDVECTVSLVAIDGEKLFYSFVRDISERKLAEQALIQARDEAERANAAKSEFLSRMSHELRTPLNAILGFGQLLEIDSGLAHEQKQYVREIMHAGSHLLELVNEVLDLARIESGHMDINPVPVAVMPVIEACIAQIRPLAAQRKISITINVAPECIVLADQTRFKQIMFNLLSNAIKYNHEEGQIVVRNEGCCKRTRISVEDTGVGINSELKARMFRPFERLASAYQAVEGTGIGLALAKKLVDAMGGEIGVESTEGKGSTFWFELPVATESATTEIHPVSRESRPAHDPAKKKYTVLYVEDNPVNLLLVSKMLSFREDIELLTATDGETGLDLIKRHLPHLVLLDINLPTIDGYEVISRLRADPRTARMPVIAATANAMPQEIDHGKAAGFTDYLTKPIKVATLFEMLERHLGRQQEMLA